MEPFQGSRASGAIAFPRVALRLPWAVIWNPFGILFVIHRSSFIVCHPSFRIHHFISVPLCLCGKFSMSAPNLSPYRFMLITVSSIESPVVTTLVLAWKARSVVIRFTNSSVRSTFESSKVLAATVPLLPELATE